MNERQHKWLERAQKDMQTASHLFYDHHPRQLEILCYLCQQAVEKALKACLVLYDGEFPLIHECRKLCELCARHDTMFEVNLIDCARLTPYATQARYPENEEITEEEALVAVQAAQRVVDFCATKIMQNEGN
ncbi:MAG: HEPN domain-containing protein [Oscillospiraceae bacterium]|nr:HEPN domain-containing protein [Oscillospiraceae bacterium]